MNRSTLSKITFYFLLIISINNYKLIAQVKIGENPTEVSTFAILELESSNKGLLLPRLTTNQRDQAFNQQTPEGMLIFNTDRQQLQYFFYDINPLTGKKTSLKKWGNSEEEIYTIVPENPKPGTLFYNQITKILYLWDKTLALWLPLNYNTAASSVTLGVEDPTMESASLEGNDSNHIRELIISESTPKTADLKDVNPGMLFAETRFGNLYLATDRNQDGTSDSWRRINGVSSSGSTQSLSASLEDQVLILKLSGGVGETSVDLSSLTQEGNQITGTDTQTLSFDTGSATASQAKLNLQGSQSLTLIASGTLSLTNTDSTTLVLTAVSSITQNTDDQTLTASLTGSSLGINLENNNAPVSVDLSPLTGTDTQTLSFGFDSATTTQTTLILQGSQSLRLIAEGVLSLSNTDSTTLVIKAHPGVVRHSTLRWDGNQWQENPSLLSDGSSQATITTNLDVWGTVSVNQRIGIGTSSPNYKLELTGPSIEDRTVGINQTPIIYLPDNSTYEGSIAFGNGLRNLQSGALGNTAVGIGALTSNTTGMLNTAIGNEALQDNTSGQYNTAVGKVVLQSNTEGNRNVGVGNWALELNKTSNANVAIGFAALRENIAGDSGTAIGYRSQENANRQELSWINQNVSIGREALRGSVVNSNNTGNFNTTVGYQSMMINAGGEKNSAYGNSTLYENTSGSGNTAIGSESMKNNSTGNYNVGIGANTLTLSSNRTGGTAIGYNSQSNYFELVSALVSNTNTSIGFESLKGNTGTGIDNTAIGYQTMVNNSSGYQNTVVGVNALSQNSSGYENSALGYQALQNNTLGFGNLALGSKALNSNTFGVLNVAIGYNSMKENVRGNFNTAVGYNALLYNVAGEKGVAIGADSQLYSRSTTDSWINTNVSIGFSSLKGSPDLDLNTGANNTAIGFNSMILNNQGSNNTSIGKDSLLKNTSGSNNVSIGVNTMEYNTTGEKNVAIGNYAGTFAASGDNLTVAGQSVFVGYNTRPEAENQTNQIVIGYNARGAGSNTVTLGNSDIISYNMYTNSWNNASDRRLKHGIRPLLYGLDFVNELNPVSYVMNNRSDEKQDYGFIAQEIQSLLETYGDTDSDIVKVLNKEKGTLGLKYNNFIPILTKAIQELKAENDALKTQNESILRRLEALENR